MNEVLEEVCEALEDVSKAVKNASNEQRPLVEAFGWHHPSVTVSDLAFIPRRLAEQIRESGLEEIGEDYAGLLEEVPNRLLLLKTHTLPQMFGGNGQQAIPAFLGTIEWISSLVQPLLFWQKIQDPKSMPPELVRRLRSLNAQLDSISIDKKELTEQIALIQEATEAAESLPADLQSLREAREKIGELLKSADKNADQISSANMISEKIEGDIRKRKEEADKLVDKCEEAYRITTTKGLAAAFEQRAGRLAGSMWIWVMGLLAALAVGAYIGSYRLDRLGEALANPDTATGVLLTQSLLSLLSLGAPLWFAWLATKQIGQRFRLSEDYAYKASVAKAYEGYRKEATRIDEVLEARLFSTALTRVEEAPLRLVEESSHGSPWHELVGSSAFQDAMKNVPELRDKFIEIAKKGMDTVKPPIKTKKNIVEPDVEE